MAERDGTATAGAHATVCLRQRGQRRVRHGRTQPCRERPESRGTLATAVDRNGLRTQGIARVTCRRQRRGRRWVVLVILGPSRKYRPSTHLVHPWTIFSTSPSITIRFARWCGIFRVSTSRPSRRSWTKPPPFPGTTSRRWESSGCWACPGARSSAAPGWIRSPTTSPSTRWQRWTRATRSPSARTPISAPHPSSSSARRNRSGGMSHCSPPGRCSAASD